MNQDSFIIVVVSIVGCERVFLKQGFVWIIIRRVFELVGLKNVFESVVVCRIFIRFIIEVGLEIKVWRVYFCIFFDSVVFIV